MIQETWVTTLDNPFDPFEEFDAWKRYDEDKGYYTAEYLARIAATSDETSDEDYWAAINDAVDEICAWNLTGNYRKVVNDSDRN